MVDKPDNEAAVDLSNPEEATIVEKPKKVEMFKEEAFGILSNDNLYLDCLFVTPRESTDEDLIGIRVWVPKYPLSKSSLIGCAKQDAKAYGTKGKIGHLLFDLRNSGNSDPGPADFLIDLKSVKAWARERFGKKIQVQFMGYPEKSGNGSVILFPVRANVAIESYEYKSSRPEKAANRPCILYLSNFGQFTSKDDQMCATLAKAGYHVFGIDPLRYLLQGSLTKRMKLKDLWHDMSLFCRTLPNKPILVGQPVGAGIALMTAVGVEEIAGVIAIGEAQEAFKLNHVFNTRNDHTFFLNRHVYQIAPRPMVIVRLPNDPLGGPVDQLRSMFEIGQEPKRFEKVEKVTSKYLYSLLQWVEENISSEEAAAA